MPCLTFYSSATSAKVNDNTACSIFILPFPLQQSEQYNRTYLAFAHFLCTSLPAFSLFMQVSNIALNCRLQYVGFHRVNIYTQICTEDSWLIIDERNITCLDSTLHILKQGVQGRHIGLSEMHKKTKIPISISFFSTQFLTLGSKERGRTNSNKPMCIINERQLTLKDLDLICIAQLKRCKTDQWRANGKNSAN